MSTGYRPKTHDLAKLLHHAVEFDRRLEDVFPRATEEDKRLFGLLQKAYVDARYNREYAIGKGELAHLHERVQILQSVVEMACPEQMGEHDF